MAADRAADAVQGASAVLAGVVVPQVLGPESVLWVLAAMGICSLADAAAPVTPSRWRLAARYCASVVVTLAASYAAGAWVTHTWPEWHGDLWPVRIGAAIVAGLSLHPLVALAPAAVARLVNTALGKVSDQEVPK